MKRPVHYIIHVRELERSIYLYRRALELEIADRHDYEGVRLVYLRGRSSDFEIELVCPDEWSYASKPEPGRCHIAFAVDELEAEHARLESHGIAPEPISDYFANGDLQTRYFYFTDPDGNQIEFLEPRGRYASGAK